MKRLGLNVYGAIVLAFTILWGLVEILLWTTGGTKR